MKRKLAYFILTVFTILLIPFVNYGQAPNLGRASSFALFTAAGAFSSTGATIIYGDIGNYVGAYSGTPTLHGNKHLLDSVAKQAATDVDSAYGKMSTLTCDTTLGVTLGNGMVLKPRIYCTGAATTLNGTLTLDAKGNPNAIFIFKINGAFTTSTFSKIILKNGASLCNVYWQVNGQFTLGDSSVFMGTVIVNGAINLLAGADLYGRALSTAGAISLSDNFVAIGAQLTATITGTKSVCLGGSTTLTVTKSNGVGLYTYLWTPGGTTDSFIKVSPTINTKYVVKVYAINGCSPAADSVTVTVSKGVAITSNPANQKVCSGSSVSFSVTATGTGLTYQWRKGTVNLTNGSGISGATSSTLTINPVTLTNAGVNYNVIVTASGACAGSDTSNNATLTVINSTTSTQTIAACNSYTWNGTAYTTSGTYTHTFTGGNNMGCDSTATLHLTVNKSTTSTQTITACNSYTWNGTAYTTSGTYTRTFTGGNNV